MQVSFLPWFSLRHSFLIGPIKFWPFPEEADSHIERLDIREHLTKYFRSYVDETGKPVNTLTICSHGHTDFRELLETENAELRSSVDILTFVTITSGIKAAVCANNRSMGPPSADLFELFTQNFQPSSDELAIQAGTVLSGGWKIGDITFTRPLSVGEMLVSPNEELLQGLAKCFSATFPMDVRQRLFRSLEWFRMAHSESWNVSALSKVVMMATAFEILLQFPRQKKRQHFVNFMENRIASDIFIKEGRTTENGKSFDLSMAGCWAWDFYELRSCIVHGDQVLGAEIAYRNWLTHLIVADLVLLECIKRVLFEERCIGDNVRDCSKHWDAVFPEEPSGGAEEQLARWFLDFKDVHEALGWIPKKK